MIRGAVAKAGALRARRRPPLLLVGAAFTAVALVCLPLAYLVLRVAEGGSDAWSVLGRHRILELVGNTALLVMAVTGAALVVGVPLAWLVARTDLPGRRLWATAAALPLVIPSYVAALVLLAAFGPRGFLQQVLERPFGVERVPEIYGLGGAVLALTISTYPYVYLLVVAAFRELDPALEEASRGLGRSRAQTFRLVTLPVLRPSLGAGALLVALYTLSDFGAVSLMQYSSLTRAIFLQYRSLFDRTPAAILSLVLVVLTLVVLLLEAYWRGRARYQRPSPGAARAGQRIRLGRWRWPALAFCGGVVGFALLLPLAVIGYWLERAVSLERGLGDVWGAALNSVVASGLAAGAAVAAALPVALLAVRYPAGWSRALERLSYSSNALPGIVIALSLVFFAANYAGFAYQTLALLIFAYVVRFFSQAVAGAHSALLRVDPRLEEAARGLGKTPRRAFASVTAPLVAPGLLAGAALVFLSTMKELPATLLLAPIGFETLATQVWTATTVASYSKAAFPALLLILFSAPFVYLLTLRRRPEVDAPG
ncbi:MAG TPA: iron ABC transporter permease [Gaiellaceae bacterium]|nr:iron ABC transporter permease [Gaiellaceae bacterium]